MAPLPISQRYWKVLDSSPATQVYSSASAAFVPLNDPDYIASGSKAFKINTLTDLKGVFAAQFPAGLPAGDTTAIDNEWNALPPGAKKLLFFLFNQVRVLKNQTPLTLAAFIVAYRQLSSPS